MSVRLTRGEISCEINLGRFRNAVLLAGGSKGMEPISTVPPLNQQQLGSTLSLYVYVVPSLRRVRRGGMREKIKKEKGKKNPSFYFFSSSFFSFAFSKFLPYLFIIFHISIFKISNT